MELREKVREHAPAIYAFMDPLIHELENAHGDPPCPRHDFKPLGDPFFKHTAGQNTPLNKSVRYVILYCPYCSATRERIDQDMRTEAT